MEKWYIKEFSKLTNVTVRTLHHYDQIGLLKPSARFVNGYRVYSEADLIKLQQIMALRFFGFSLSVIKDIMKKKKNVIEYLKAQREHMNAQILHLQDASQTLDAIINDIINDTQQLYSPELLKHFAKLQKNYTNREIASAKNRWEMLMVEIQSCLEMKPESAAGRRLARRWKILLKEINNNDPQFQGAVLLIEEGKEAQFPAAGQEVISWIEKALAFDKKIRSPRMDIDYR